MADGWVEVSLFSLLSKGLQAGSWWGSGGGVRSPEWWLPSLGRVGGDAVLDYLALHIMVTFIST